LILEICSPQPPQAGALVSLRGFSKKKTIKSPACGGCCGAKSKLIFSMIPFYKSLNFNHFERFGFFPCLHPAEINSLGQFPAKTNHSRQL